MPKTLTVFKITGVVCCVFFLASCQTEKPLEKTQESTRLPEKTETAFPTPPSNGSMPAGTATLTPSGTNVSQPDEEITRFYSGSKVEVSFTGPPSAGLDPESNPFEIIVDIKLESPDGNVILLPAFYDGDGFGGLDGDVWKFRYSTVETGLWHYTVMSEETILDGTQGSFEVVLNPECDLEYNLTEDLRCKGHLGHTGGYYLQFQDGESWIKTGLDDPENFLGTAFGDWDAKRSQLDLLSQLGINSIYVITNNIDGDRRDTWPWVGETEAQVKTNPDRFDVAKLQEWEDLFSYAQQKGIVLHLVLNDDSAWRGYDEQLYIREMVSRFGHHPGIIWNVGEEANEIYSDQEQETFAALIKELDPFDHPVTVHRKSPWPFLGNKTFNLASIQMGDGSSDFSTSELMDYNKIVIEHRERSNQLGNPIPIMIDETPRITEINENVQNKFRTQVLYPIYLGGGNFELHYRDAYGQNGSVTIDDLRPLIQDMVNLRFVLEPLPVLEMLPCNQLLSNPDNLCFGDPDSVMVIYLPGGGSETIDLTQINGNFKTHWIDPQSGESEEPGMVQSGELVSITAPSDQDWLLLLDADGA